MYYPKQFALALSIILLCLNITPITGEYISVSHNMMSGLFSMFIGQPVFAGIVWVLASIIAVLAIRSTFYAQQASEQN